MGEVLCSTENSPFLIIDHIHAKINRVCCAALAIGKICMNVRKNKLLYLTRIQVKLPKLDVRVYLECILVPTAEMSLCVNLCMYQQNIVKICSNCK